MKKVRLGLCTGGGDCPGLNAAIRAVVRHATLTYRMDIYGIRDGLTGLVKSSPGASRLPATAVEGILQLGGTILGTNNQGSPFRDKQAAAGLIKAMQGAAARLKLDGLVVIGGDGTHYMARHLVKAGMKIVGIPKTIDNDLIGTDETIGFATAVDIAAEAATRLGSSATAHSRIMILEVMGRDAGHIALASALAGGAHAVLLPEIPYALESLVKAVRQRQKAGLPGFLIVAAEGAHARGGDPHFQEVASGGRQLGGVGAQVARQLHELTGLDARVAVLGHVQRGGPPNAADRLLAAKLAVRAVDLAAAGKFGRIVGIRNGALAETSYASVGPKRRLITMDDPLLRTAEATGINLGRHVSASDR